jgi:hypothetical protein
MDEHMEFALRMMPSQFEAWERDTQKLKSLLETLLKNKEIPLEQRWELFLRAPDAFKNTHPWIIHPEEDIPGLTEITWFDDYYDKHETVVLSDWVERIEMDHGHKPNDAYMQSKYKHLDDIKEWILERNLHSFILDW